MSAVTDAEAAARAGVQRAYAAAAMGLARGEATAAIGVAEGQLGYTLTQQMIAQDQPPLVFALIPLSFTAIQEGFTAYIWVNATAKVSRTEIGLQMEVANNNLEKLWKAAQNRIHT